MESVTVALLPRTARLLADVEPEADIVVEIAEMVTDVEVPADVSSTLAAVTADVQERSAVPRRIETDVRDVAADRYTFIPDA